MPEVAPRRVATATCVEHAHVGAHPAVAIVPRERVVLVIEGRGEDKADVDGIAIDHDGRRVAAHILARLEQWRAEHQGWRSGGNTSRRHAAIRAEVLALVIVVLAKLEVARPHWRSAHAAAMPDGPPPMTATRSEGAHDKCTGCPGGAAKRSSPMKTARTAALVVKHARRTIRTQQRLGSKMPTELHTSSNTSDAHPLKDGPRRKNTPKPMSARSTGAAKRPSAITTCTATLIADAGFLALLSAFCNDRFNVTSMTEELLIGKASACAGVSGTGSFT
eukprot:2452280-Prymnesium_polylepis.1